MQAEIQPLMDVLQQVKGYIYPNEVELHWGLLVVVYPYITGLVAGAFILASLERVFNVREVQPTYRLSLLTALAFLIIAPLPLLAHLGHPIRSFEIFLTPNVHSAMAMFGFVYAWYLTVVLLLEIWFDYRKDAIVWAREAKGLRRLLYRVFTLGANDLSVKSLRFDRRAGRLITLIGIPSAFLLHGYVGFIFGSVKANPWWSSVLIPVVFLFSAIVSGIALILVLYMLSCLVRGKEIDMSCADKLASFLLYALIVDFSLEMLDFIHRLYEAEESISILSQMISGRLFLEPGGAPDPLGDFAPHVVSRPGESGVPYSRPGFAADSRGTPPPDLFRGRLAHPDGDLQHPVERGDRRPVVLEEPPRIDCLQDGIAGAGRLLHVGLAAHPALHSALYPGADTAALARQGSPSGRRRRRGRRT